MLIGALILPLLTLQSGKLVIKDIKVGTGSAAQVGDYLTMDYTGTLLSGKQFDSSIGRAPFNFVLGAGQVIKGWDIGVVGMKVGGKRALVIPSELAYGKQGAGADIPPNATLKFVIQLKKIDRVQITILKAGHGNAIKNGDTISVHYKGTLSDGKQFDSSYDHGQPMTLTLGRPGLIPGFTAGLAGMKLGEKRRVWIPSTMGYGDHGAGGVIPPNANLTFELELVQVNK
jgi:FKBP-type peptidyl-prolyl cis-trans isomerase